MSTSTVKMGGKVDCLLLLLACNLPSGVAPSCTASMFCQILLWGPWSNCSSGCGQGVRYRQPGLCCPKGVTLQTIFEECAVKRCNMTESEYNQTDTCLSTDTCTTAPGETTEQDTLGVSQELPSLSCESKTNQLNPFGLLPLVVGSTLLVATLASAIVCVVYGAKRYRRRKGDPKIPCGLPIAGAQLHVPWLMSRYKPQRQYWRRYKLLPSLKMIFNKTIGPNLIYFSVLQMISI